MRAELSVEDAYRKWADELVAYATALVGPSDAADLVADAFAGVIARGDEAWQAVREPRGYLFRSVLNAARMSARAPAIDDDPREQRSAAAFPTGELLGDPSVVRVLDGLSVRQRAVTYLTYWEDLDVGAVAELLGISPGAVKRHLARARRALRSVLTNEVHDA